MSFSLAIDRSFFYTVLYCTVCMHACIASIIIISYHSQAQMKKKEKRDTWEGGVKKKQEKK
jgi:hypothetical protein